MLFAGAGYHVVLYDIQQSQLQGALVGIKGQLEKLEVCSIMVFIRSFHTSSIFEMMRFLFYAFSLVVSREALISASCLVLRMEASVHGIIRRFKLYDRAFCRGFWALDLCIPASWTAD